MVGSLIAAGVVYLIVNNGGEGPTFGRVLLALPLLFALSEPLLSPFSFLGLLLSAAVLANAQRKVPDESNPPYEYRQPPLQP